MIKNTDFGQSPGAIDTLITRMTGFLFVTIAYRALPEYCCKTYHAITVIRLLIISIPAGSGFCRPCGVTAPAFMFIDTGQK